MHYPGSELVADSRLNADADPYLADYLIDGTAVLPAVLALEAMAQAASALAGQPLRHAEQVCFDAPVVIRQDKTLRVCAKREGRHVTAALRSQQDGRWTEHGRAIFRVAEPSDLPTLPEQRDGGAPGVWETAEPTLDILDSTDLYGSICFQSGRFRRVAFLPELSSRRCRALIRGGDDQPWFGAVAGLAGSPLVLGSPGLNDATIHVLQACFPHRRMQPAGCDSVTISGRPVRGAVEVRAVQRPAPAAGPRPSRLMAPEDGLSALASLAAPVPPVPDEYVWDVTAADATGQPIISWRGLRLIEAGPVPGHPVLPPGLLGVLLERGASGLGLDPALRVAVRCEQPQYPPAGRRAARSGAATPPRLAGWVSARSRDELDEYSLRLRAASPAACAWATAQQPTRQPAAAPTPGTAPKSAAAPKPATTPRPAAAREPGTSDPEFAALHRQLCDILAEPAAIVDARIATAVECLSKAGRPVGCELVADGRYADGWTLLR
ncbi:MAG TPA: hypothetical protein VGI64_06245, partial [Streptosporangiaceae bacterium]